MARAFQSSRPLDDDAPQDDWQALRHELVALLDQVDGQVARNRDPSLSERVRDLRHQVAEADAGSRDRHRDALRQVQRAITRFDEPAVPPNPRDTLQAAIDQIRQSQNQNNGRRAASPMAPSVPSRADGVVLERLAQSVNGLGNRLERLEGEIKAQVRTGANVKDVADQVAQLAHVVELLAGAVGETGQVKRLEGQIASLGKIMSQGREMDQVALARRLDDVAATVGKLAELQVHYADRVQNPLEQDAFRSGMASIDASVRAVYDRIDLLDRTQNPLETEVFRDGMAAIEQSVRAVYDRIDTLERNSSLSSRDLEELTGTMARFTEAMKANASPQNLIDLVDALNARMADLESGDKIVHGLRRDLGTLRDAIVVSLAPRFDAIDRRLESVSTHDDMAEIARQIGELGDRMVERPIDGGIGQLEAQVRQLVARMDQTGEQLSGLAKLYSEPQPLPDFDSMADRVAMRTFEAMQRHNVPDTALTDTISGLESRIVAMLGDIRRDPEVNDFTPMQAGIAEVNERLARLEASLLARGGDAPAPLAPMAPARPDDMAPLAFAEPIPAAPAPVRSDIMPRSPAADAPLNAPPFPEPTGPVQQALDAKSPARKRHPGLEDDLSLAARYDVRPAPPAPPPGFEKADIAPPPKPQPSAEFADVAPTSVATTDASAEPSPAAETRRNTFIEAHRRAAQRATPAPEAASNSLIGRALSRFQTVAGVGKTKAEPTRPALAGDKPPRKTFQPEPVIDAIGTTPAVTAPVADAPAPKVKGKAPKARSAKPEPVKTSAPDGDKAASDGESFLLKHRKVILLGAAVVAMAFLTINLVAQRMLAEAPAADAPAAAPIEPTTTGDVGDGLAPATDADAAMPEPVDGPRVIPMVDSLKTGAIDPGAVQGFTTTPLQPMPSAFEAATEVANVDPGDVAPLASSAPEASPVKVDLPPEGLGPIELRQAAADGDARAQFEIAAIYTEGRAVPQDYAAAATWYERSAAQGFAPAQYRLGSLYESGNGVTKDLNTAKLWYERAAEAGNRMSMHNLAALYAGGQLGKQQFDSAAKWFEEAADRGLIDSQFNLGMLYARGLGVAQDLQQSFKWFGIAALTGDKDAAKARDDIARSLDADTVNKLTVEIEGFKAKPIDMAANFAPIGTWSKGFDPGETITTRDIVTSVQKALSRLGYDVGTPDGVAGAKTIAAIKSFEGATGMSQVGLINPRLLAVLGSQPV